MKKVLCLMLILGSLFINPVTAGSEPVYPDLSNILDDHGAVMLLINPETGSILYANDSAVRYYGYPKEQLLAMTISQINILSPQEVSEEMQAASEEQRNYFEFKHRLANGEIRSVEVFSYPVVHNNENLLFLVVHDVTEKVLLQEKEERITDVVFGAGSGVIISLLLMVFLLIRSAKKIKESQKEVENFNELRQTFIDADKNLVYLKDENLKYVFVNRAVEAFYNRSAEEILGLNDFDLSETAFAQKRRKTDMDVLKKMTLVVDQVEWGDRVYRTTKFPVKMLNGKYGVGAYVQDITEERKSEEKQKKTLQRHMIMVDMLSHRFHGRREQLDFVLNEALKLTESEHGYIYLYDEESKSLSLNSWTKGVMEKCAIAEKQTKYQLENTGIWGEVVRQKKPIIINDFEQPHPLKRGYPQGHVELKNFMSIPVIIEENIFAVVGLANKQGDYDDNDVYEMTLLMSGIWNAVKKREALDRLSYERNKYFKTLVSIGDGVMVMDLKGNIEMMNSVAQRLTGWSFEEAKGKNYKEVFVLSSENSDCDINDPIEDVLQTDKIQELENHGVLTSANGSIYHIEDSAAPIKDDENNTLGVVLVFRDVTEKNEQRKKIEYLSFHDALTGLYNRRFFEEEMKRLDTDRNLPISVIIGDVDGLKLTNDIFGHVFGDKLLQSAAMVLRRVCRADDIIARWGGDEFVILLPQTNKYYTQKIVERIKGEFAKEEIQAVKGSISVGFAVKEDVSQDIAKVLDSAEKMMYSTKATEREEVRNNVIDRIIATLHQNSQREMEHAVRLRELCGRFAKVLNLSEAEIRNAEDAGYFHDIGKIVLEQELLNKKYYLSQEEFKQVKGHSAAGFRILNSFDETMHIADSVLYHHERWDGTGYPKGLRGGEIPYLSRIIAIADSYDELKNEKAMSDGEIIKYIRDNKGRLFDPELAEKFISFIEAEK